MEDSVGQALQSLVKVISQKDGKSEEEVLTELSTPEGMDLFTRLMTFGATGASGSLKKTQTLARSCGRSSMYVDCILKHCPWLGDELTNSEHGCSLVDCRGEAQHLYFALDLASANGFYPSRFSMCLEKLRWYASEHMVDPADYLGTKMMEDCIEHMACAPADALRMERKESDDEDSDTDEEMEEWLVAMDTEESRQSAKLLRGRTACVDVTEETWPSVEHLEGICSVVTCTSLLIQVGYREPYIWADVLQGAAKLLEKGGILLMYDSEKWGDYGDVEKMKQQIQNAGLDLELIERDEPVDYSSDTDGRMFLLVFRKTASGQRRSTSWLRTRAEELKQEGNSFYANPAKSRHDSEQLSSSPRDASLWKAVACYVQGLDCVCLARSLGDQDLNHLSSRLYSNLAAAYIELASTANTYEHALKVIDLALVCDPEWDRAKQRKQKIEEVMAKRSQRAGA